MASGCHLAECGQGPLVMSGTRFPEFWWSWRHQLVGLAEAGFRVVAVDLRGYGDLRQDASAATNLWTLAGDLAGLVRALGERRATVVGHAWGGLVAWTLAALHPRLVQSPRRAEHPRTRGPAQRQLGGPEEAGLGRPARARLPDADAAGAVACGRTVRPG